MLIMQICIPKGSGRIFQDIRKKGEFRAKAGTSVGVKRGERENMLVEHDITRDIDPPFFGIKALKAFVQVTISKEDALF